MAKRNIRVGIKMSYVDEEGNIADNGDTLYYGEYETDPDEGIRYTYVKTPEGNFDLLMTENTGKAEEMIDKIVEVGLKDSNNYSPKLTYVLQLDKQDNVSTWNDRIEDLFKKEFANLYPNLKPTIMHVKSYDIKRAILMPFYNEKAVVTSFELTPGRTTRNIGQLTVELFRRLMDETLKFLDQFLEILNEGFNSLDDLKMVDMKQDEKLGDISTSANSWELICELIRKWMIETSPKFKTRHKKYTIDLTNYRSNLTCGVRLFSSSNVDKPYMETQIYTPGKSLASILSTSSKGINMDMKINKGNTNEVLPPKNQTYTVGLQGGKTYIAFCSAEKLEYQVISTENISNIKPSYNNTRIDTGDHYEEDYHTWLESDPERKDPWHLTISGGFGDKGVVGYVYNYLWRSNNYNSWGAGGDGNNTSCLQQNKDIGEFKNTRISFTMNMTVAEMRRRFKQLTIYTDGWYGMTSTNGSGGIQNFRDGSGRCSYNGYGVWANNEASIPSEKLKVPLRMTNESETSGCAAKITVDIDQLSDDGSWLAVYTSPTGGSWYSYTIEHMRRKGRAFGCMRWIYYIRVKDPNTIELLVNYFQFIDGDSGNSVQTQSAGRTSALIVGEKKTSAVLNVDRVFSDRESLNIKNNPATDLVNRTNITSDSGSISYVGFDKTFTFSTEKIQNPIIAIGINALMRYKHGRDHHGTCGTDNTQVDGTLAKYTVRTFGDGSDHGTNPGSVANCPLVDNESEQTLIDTSEVLVRFQPTGNVTDKVLKQILFTSNQGSQYYQLLATVTNNGPTRSVRLVSRFYSPGMGGRNYVRISFSMNVGVIISAGGEGVAVKLEENRPSGKALELYDISAGRALYAPLVTSGSSKLYFSESKATNSTKTSGSHHILAFSQSQNIGSARELSFGINCNFMMKYSRNHHDTSGTDDWACEGNLSSWRQYRPPGGNNVGHAVPARPAPSDIGNSLEGINKAEMHWTLNRSSLTSTDKQIYTTGDMANQHYNHVGPGNWYFRVYVKIEGDIFTVTYKFEMLNSCGSDGNRNIARCSYWAKTALSVSNPTRKTLSVVDLSDGKDYRLPDNSDTLGEIIKSISFRNALFDSHNINDYNSKLNIENIASLKTLLDKRKYLVGINLNIGVAFTELVNMKKIAEDASYCVNNNPLMFFGQDGELYTLSSDELIKVNRNESVGDFVDTFSGQYNLSTIKQSEDEPVLYDITRYSQFVNIIKKDIPININTNFHKSNEPVNPAVKDPKKVLIEDLNLRKCDILLTIDPEHLDNVWCQLFDLIPVNYKTNMVDVKVVLSCYARIDDNNLQFGWRLHTKYNGIKSYSQNCEMKWTYNILEVGNE